jgi:serine/threonine protein kinase
VPSEARKLHATLPGSVDDGPAPESGAFPRPQRSLKAVRAGDLIQNRYRILSAAATGGMGSVYVCDDTLLGRPVAVKLVHVDANPDSHLPERFFAEARISAQLESPHIARLYDYGVATNGEPYMVMEFVDGPDLFAVLQTDGPRSSGEVVNYALQICEGLREAHRKGIVHCDLKPENLILTRTPEGDPLVKIIDFGISKWKGDPWVVTLTRTAILSGSPNYMSPEQIETPARVDARTDIWSLGVVMFELLTGQLPFEGPDEQQTCACVLSGPVPTVSTLLAAVPPELETIIERCMKKDRNERFSDVDELARALSDAVLATFTTNGQASTAEASTAAEVLTPTQDDDHAPASAEIPTSDDEARAPDDRGDVRRASHWVRGTLAALAITVPLLLGVRSDESAIHSRSHVRSLCAPFVHCIDFVGVRDRVPLE